MFKKPGQVQQQNRRSHTVHGQILVSKNIVKCLKLLVVNVYTEVNDRESVSGRNTEGGACRKEKQQQRKRT